MAVLQSIPVEVTSNGDAVLITGSVAFPTIQVVGIYFQVSAATTIKLKEGTGSSGVNFTGGMPFNAGGGLNLPNNGNVYFECDNGLPFVLNLSGLLGSVGGAVMFFQF
jgi:hypothetical protein